MYYKIFFKGQKLRFRGIKQLMLGYSADVCKPRARPLFQIPLPGLRTSRASSR